MTELGYLLETFCVGEVLKQAGWMKTPAQPGHWRTHDGDEVDLVLERAGGAFAAIEVKAGERALSVGGCCTLAPVVLVRRAGDRLGATRRRRSAVRAPKLSLDLKPTKNLPPECLPRRTRVLVPTMPALPMTSRNRSASTMYRISQRRLPKKRVAVGVVGAFVAAGVALAYFTTTGTGSGNAKVGTSEPLTISAVSASDLYPGTTSNVTFTVTNPSTGHQFVKKVKLEEVKAYKDEAHTEPEAGCKSDWFSMPEVTENRDVAHGETALEAEGTLEFVNKAESQDACKGAYLVASFSSN